MLGEWRFWKYFLLSPVRFVKSFFDGLKGLKKPAKPNDILHLSELFLLASFVSGSVSFRFFAVAFFVSAVAYKTYLVGDWRNNPPV